MLSVVNKYSDEQYVNTSNINHACMSPDYSYVLVGGNSKVFVFDKETEELEERFDDIHYSKIRGCDWNPRGHQFATIDSTGGLIIWE